MSGADVQVMLRDIDFSGYTDVHFEYGQVHVKGGKLGKEMPMMTRKARTGTLFVQCGMNQRWLMVASTGRQQGFNANMFGSKNLLFLLKDLVQQACDGDLETQEAAVGAGDEATALDNEAPDAEEYDPMDEVDCMDEENISPAKKPRQETRGCGEQRARKSKNHARGRVLDIDFQNTLPRSWRLVERSVVSSS